LGASVPVLCAGATVDEPREDAVGGDVADLCGLAAAVVSRCPAGVRGG
jgi:hypothetical protein